MQLKLGYAPILFVGFVWFATAGCNRQPSPTQPAGQNSDASPSTIESDDPNEVVEVEIANVIEMKFCWMPPGEAQLGPPEEELERVKKCMPVQILADLVDTQSESARGKFKTSGYWLGKYPVTQSEWEAVMGSNPSWFSKGGECKERIVE